MVTIKEVKTKSDIKKFVKFPTMLYKGNPYYVHPLEIDEINKFDKNKNESFDDCIVKCFLAYRDGKVVGRIAGIIQTLYNEKAKEKGIRFSRFDSIDDEEVSNALFSAMEAFGKSQGMQVIHGPLGYNDLDREGLLIEGFNQLSTFEEQYNYSYYPKLVEKYGFKKEADWVEYRLFKPKQKSEKLERIAQTVLKRYNLKLVTATNLNKFIEQYMNQVFETLDEAYGPLYGVVPYTDKVKKAILGQFKLVLNKKFIVVVVDSTDKVVGFGLCLPSISKSVSKSKGRLLPFGIFRMLMQIKRPKAIDLGLVAIRPEYQNKGLNAIILNHIINGMMELDLEYAETNLMLEDNTKIQNQWEFFEHIQHKRRRSYIKPIK